MNIEPTGRPAAIRFADVSFSYGDIPVLQSASFHVHGGEFAALVGRNGAGKTTVLKLILGLLRPDGGSIAVLGSAPAAARSSVGYVPQARPPGRLRLSVEEAVWLGRCGRLGRSVRRGFFQETEHGKRGLKPS